jgi:hypothetical protein
MRTNLPTHEPWRANPIQTMTKRKTTGVHFSFIRYFLREKLPPKSNVLCTTDKIMKKKKIDTVSTSQGNYTLIVSSDISTGK